MIERALKEGKEAFSSDSLEKISAAKSFLE